MSFVLGRGQNTGDIATWDGTKWVVGANSGSSQDDEQTFPVALGEVARNMWSGSPSAGRFFATGLIIPSVFTVNKLSCYLPAAGSGTIAMGLYDAAGNRLAQSWDGVSSSFVTTTTGFNFLNVQTPYVTVAEQLYYLGITIRANGATFMSCESRLNSGTPLFGVEDDNGNAGSQMRATMNPNAGGRTYRLWCGALG